ncbi:GspE/PulE family protein [Sulfuritalea sp.]|uniref:GspE/PulE family protein n=1 Tax=Sulfuritalea sp. TaxID=2480090 RepID=UPI00286DFA91|nr:GspE/PulE family protein [Sulfuritalea sp.]
MSVSSIQAALAVARADAQESGAALMDALEACLALPADEFVAAVAQALDHRPFIAADLHRMAGAFDVIPYAESARRVCVALRDDKGDLFMVVADPFNEALRRWAEDSVAERFRWGLAHAADLGAYLVRHEDTLHAMDGALPAQDAMVEGDERVETLSLRSIGEHDSPVVKLVHSTLYDALKAGASDIHLECTPAGLSIKYRIDGVLAHNTTMPGVQFAEQVISRIKVMSELDIAERRVPQDGRFKVLISDRAVDFRVSIMPSIFGEDAVLRILDRRALTDHVAGLRLEALGFDAPMISQLRALAEEPYGMLLVTGPTGSGKTTTLYAAVSEINHGRDKIVTIEDPVEYQLPGVLQIPVNEKKGLTFARGLRSILRHDPDKILVGEIRDPETAQIAVQAALTGHLVFTTVHANSAFDVIGRFLHMEVDPYSFVSAVNGIVAQRLVRLLCPDCAEDSSPDAELLRKSGITPAQGDEIRFRIGRGCGKCRGTGYRGRHAIAELLLLNDDLRELIIDKAPARRIKEAAAGSGTRFLRQAALDVVRSGATTLEEINRVTLAV